MTYPERIIDDLLENIPESMLDYMVRNNITAYNAADVAAFKTILVAYLANIAAAITLDEALAVVRESTIKLNDLNDKCGGVLIEDGEWEDIAELKTTAFAAQGFVMPDIDNLPEGWAV